MKGTIIQTLQSITLTGPDETEQLFGEGFSKRSIDSCLDLAEIREMKDMIS